MAATSNVSSTNGGIDFDTFCTCGVPNYTSNPVDLADDDDEKETGKMDRDVTKLSERVKDTIKDYETQGIEGQKVCQYYIGKTYLKRKKNSGSKLTKKQSKIYLDFDRMKFNTWIKKGISSRYRVHKKKEYGCNGLVVLGVVTKEILPKKRAKAIKKEDYALILEQRLVHHLLIEEADERLQNKTFNEGKRQEKFDEPVNEAHDAFAYAIYMTLGCEEQGDETTQQQTQTQTVKKDTKKEPKNKTARDPQQSYIDEYFRKDKKSQRKVTFSGTQ